MGKDSLIKSTSRKKTKSANEEETKKKTVTKAATKPKKTAKPKKAKKSPAKTTKVIAAKTTAQKTKSAGAKPKAKTAAAKPKAKTAAAKSSAKKSAAPAKPKAKPKAAAQKTKKATIPELLAKKFDSLPGAPEPKPAAPEKKVFEASPPVVSPSDPAEAARIRALLMTKFSMAEVKAAAKPPEPQKTEAAAKMPEPEKPKAAAPEAPAPEPEAPKGETPPAKGVETPSAPADEPPVITTTAVQEDAPEPTSRAIKYGIAAMALLVLILLGISNNNSSKYYIHPKEDALEIWKGCFSPKDNQFFMVLQGVQLDQEVKDVYSRSDVYPMIFDYYLKKADTLLEVPGLPDFEGIKGYLYQAQSYAITPKMKDKAKGRLNSIERMILLYRADVAISKNTKDSLKAALKHLQKASGLVANPTQQQEIGQKIELVKKLQNEIKPAP